MEYKRELLSRINRLRVSSLPEKASSAKDSAVVSLMETDSKVKGPNKLDGMSPVLVEVVGV